MGVMQCNRKGCEAILCDFYSSHYGYICHECMNELKSKVPDVSVDGFMSSEKDGGDLCKQLMKAAAIDFINREFTDMS